MGSMGNECIVFEDCWVAPESNQFLEIWDQI